MNQLPATSRTLTRAKSFAQRPSIRYSTQPSPRPPVPQPQESSKVLPTVLLLGGGTAAGLGAYYYAEPNAEIFKQARSALGMETPKQNAVKEYASKQPAPKPKPIVTEKPKVAKLEMPAPPKTAPPPPAPPKQEKPAPQKPAEPVKVPIPALAAVAATAAAAAAVPPPTPPKVLENTSKESTPTASGDTVPKSVLVTALRAQQEALVEAHEAKVKTIQSEYERKLTNATNVIEAERVVDLRAKYEKASAALQAIEQGIETRTTQNIRAKRLRALWAQVNALHARVNHPEYHDSTTTQIDKKRLLTAIEVPDQFVNQMVGSLPSQPVHSMESLKQRFYDELEPVAKSVTLIRDGEEFSMWKYALGKVFGGAIARVNNQTVAKENSPVSSSPVQQTVNALDTARTALEKSDLLSAAIAVNQLRGLPRQVASDWLADARTLLETNQTLFVLMTYAASNNVF